MSDRSSAESQSRAERAADQERRARAAIEAISSGSDVTAEALKLSNEFTDRQVGRLRRAIRRSSP